MKVATGILDWGTALRAHSLRRQIVNCDDLFACDSGKPCSTSGASSIWALEQIINQLDHLN